MSGVTNINFIDFLRRAGAKAIDEDVAVAIQDQLDVRFFHHNGDIDYGVRGDLTVNHKGGETHFVWRFNTHSWYIKYGMVEAVQQDDILALVSTVTTAHDENGVDEQLTEMHNCSLSAR